MINKIKEYNKFKKKLKRILEVDDIGAQNFIDGLVKVKKFKVEDIEDNDDFKSILKGKKKDKQEKIKELFNSTKDIYVATSDEKIYKIGV